MVDRQNRAGHKGGAPSTDQEMAMDRRERLRKLAMETIDLSKDPYFMPNHLGSYECKLCLTLHTNEGSYLAHTQGKKHQVNLARRAQKEKEQQQFGVAPAPKTQKTGGPRKTIKIGRPGYRVTKCREPITKQKALLFEIEYPEIEAHVAPKTRVMSTYEQKVESPDPTHQYLLVAAEPYETICFKVPNMELDKEGSKWFESWDRQKKIFTFQVYFKEREAKELPALPQRSATTSLAFHGGGGFTR
eukprot:GEMP01025940.1.p1 GENE.GEMP01025940.1~~GEMP01025940.1.p1  ORF type:complete len:245 (+),score=70.16 GEMP01025940.1:42-776(+)